MDYLAMSLAPPKKKRLERGLLSPRADVECLWRGGAWCELETGHDASIGLVMEDAATRLLAERHAAKTTRVAATPQKQPSAMLACCPVWLQTSGGLSPKRVAPSFFFSHLPSLAQNPFLHMHARCSHLVGPRHLLHGRIMHVPPVSIPQSSAPARTERTVKATVERMRARAIMTRTEGKGAQQAESL